MAQVVVVLARLLRVQEVAGAEVLSSAVVSFWPRLAVVAVAAVMLDPMAVAVVVMRRPL
jgi:hypothetical protein